VLSSLLPVSFLLYRWLSQRKKAENNTKIHAENRTNIQANSADVKSRAADWKLDFRRHRFQHDPAVRDSDPLTGTVLRHPATLCRSK